MNSTRQIVRRTLAGIGISLFAIVAMAAAFVPSGAFEGRAASLHIDEPAAPEAVTAPPYPEDEQPVAPAPAPPPGPSDIRPAPTTTTTTTTTIPTVIAPEPARQGHYACTGDDDATADCVNDEPGPIHVDVNPGSDEPSRTLGEKDPAYGARLTAELCAVKPVMCP